MSIRRLAATAAGGLVIAFGVGPIHPLLAQVKEDPNADTPIIREVATQHIFEVRVGRVAEKKATNVAVKQFAQKMVTDHASMQNQWSTLISRNGPFLPSLGRERTDQLKRLEKISGADFDRTYMSVMIDDHAKAVNYLQTQSQAAQSAQVRERIAADLPIVQQHLSLAQQVGSQVGATSSVAVNTPNPPVVTQNPPVVTQNPPVVTQNPPTQTPPVVTQNPPVVSQATPANRAEIKADRRFIQEAMADNFMVVRMGQLAENRATNSATRQFGQRMVTDHEQMQNQWVAMTSRNGMPMKPGMGRLHRVKEDRLKKASANEFDRLFLDMMVKEHQERVGYYSKEGRSAHSAQVRQVVDYSLPILQQHLTMAKQLGAPVGVDTLTARVQASIK
jgi:putative membrane protein